MKPLARLSAAVVPLASVLLLVGFTSDHAVRLDVPVIVTGAPVYEPLAALHSAERFPRGARLLRVQGADAEPLVPEFAASADANVSFNAQTVLFAGKKSSGDPWQIWELTLADHSLRQVTAGARDAIRPLLLPGRRLVFARRMPSGNFGLVAADLDGKNEVNLTPMRASAIPSDVLADGRILFESGYPLGTGGTPELFLIYSDGSGVESYRCDHPALKTRGRWGGHQLASGDVVFTHGASLARFTSPLATEEHVAVSVGEYSGGIVETANGDWLLSARAVPSARYALMLWSTNAANGIDGGPQKLTTLLARPAENLVDVAVIAPRERPHHHPSALHDWDYANVLALDARMSREGTLKGLPQRVRVETQDASGRTVTLGMSTVEADGSFFVKTPADRPIRFALLDARGGILREEHGWFWMRGGEQRICVGCHTGPERAAENRVPAVLLRSTTPTDLSVMTFTSTARPNPHGSR